ncbi:MAG: hypothetical protein FWG13_08560, partial [Leptospirales bacterium]|nr:hypothetical protein [Leptospirales bacterium]
MDMMDQSEKLVKTIHGHRCKQSKAVGFCYNINHKGYVTKRLLKEHECLEKQCFLLEKLGHDYWRQMEADKKQRQARYKAAQQKKSRDAERNDEIRAFFEPYEQIYITSIQEINYGLKIAYIYDGYTAFSAAIKTLRKK